MSISLSCPELFDTHCFPHSSLKSHCFSRASFKKIFFCAYFSPHEGPAPKSIDVGMNLSKGFSGLWVRPCIDTPQTLEGTHSSLLKFTLHYEEYYFLFALQECLAVPIRGQGCSVPGALCVHIYPCPTHPRRKDNSCPCHGQLWNSLTIRSFILTLNHLW